MWLIYALGGGWGHLTRAIALARAAGGRRVRILTNSPYARTAANRFPALDLAVLDPGAARQATRAAVIRAIEECRPECLIVDTFPRGIGGELPELAEWPRPTVLVHRDLNARYVAAAGLGRFVRERYDLILVPGKGEGAQFGDLPTAETTAPWLVRQAEEIPAEARVRETLRLGAGEDNCVVVCASGEAEELGWYGAVMGELARRGAPARLVAAARPAGVAEEDHVQYWPAMDLYGCAGVVVGGAGYNTIAECGAWQVPLVAHAWPRRYDGQEARARRAAAVMAQEAGEAAEWAVKMRRRGRGRAPEFANGAGEGVAQIERKVRERTAGIMDK